MAASIPALHAKNVKDFLDSIDAFLFDCDGVLWHGSNVIPGVVETLEWLRSLGKKVYFVTNNSRSSRLQYKKKIESFGIKAEKREVFSSSYAAAAYLKSITFAKKAYIVGGQGVGDELEEAGIKYGGVEEHARIVPTFEEVVQHCKRDDSIGAVVVGIDLSTSYLKIAYAQAQLTDPNVLFIATNEDETFPMASNTFLPGAGIAVSSLKTCTGRTPTVVGKPVQWFLDSIIETEKLDRKRTCMVGDRLETDILFGIDGKLTTLLVLTGVHNEQDALSRGIVPSYVLPSLPDLMKLHTSAAN